MIIAVCGKIREVTSVPYNQNHQDVSVAIEVERPLDPMSMEDWRAVRGRVIGQIFRIDVPSFSGINDWQRLIGKPCEYYQRPWSTNIRVPERISIYVNDMPDGIHGDTI